MPSDPIHSTDDSFEDDEPIGSEDYEPIGNAIAPKDDDLDLNGESETIDADETETVKHDEPPGWRMGGSLPEMMKPRKPVIHLTAVMPSLLDLHQQRSDFNEDAEWSPSLTPQGIGIDVDP